MIKPIDLIVKIVTMFRSKNYHCNENDKQET